MLEHDLSVSSCRHYQNNANYKAVSLEYIAVWVRNTKITGNNVRV